ncbi:hypothetical protein [Roseicella aerolata]|uniref:Curlin associated repeat-containing protein n=1 Tax=Roseicella aerolata TaxID=2883479 RepID=A0A9X1LAR6_9PROT|nr:hypothetical protein [Roseicella aerolata]MCB4825296.1 hypothetical protein [Roseicella aerolata]
MIRTLALASALALGTLGAAQAQSAPQLVGGGNDAVVVYGAPSHNIAGGGRVLLSGGGDNRSFRYEALQAQPGRAATIQGGGADRQIVYAPAGSTQTVQTTARGIRG